MSNYATTSPYYGTPKWGQFLDLWKGAVIPPAVTDAEYSIGSSYSFRPDLLAHDMYQDSNLWWVFSVRNPDVLPDPLLSFSAGKTIYVPTRATIQKALGF